ncbi:hypothetical protein N3K66_007955 [Trichothecium roseum]|uniref:Uncharacterized protein n=1 Tax=Trichothecium roseum TaxID=47278 RepID=A0ACC0USG2_9HYPO|nr:hypothetical protein N3K66_007955 [Trichothecium roseum]
MAMNYQPPRPTSRSGFEIAVICALSLEADAVEAVIDHHWDGDGPSFGKTPGDPNTYSTGTLGRHNIVLAHMPGTGKAIAATVAANIRLSFPNIKLAMVVGVCGCVPFKSSGDEVILGDVIIGNGVVQYDLGRRTPEGFAMKNTLLDSLGRPNAEVRGFLSKLEGYRSQKRLRDKMALYLEQVQREPGLAADYPGVEHDRLYEAAYRHVDDGSSCKECGCNGALITRMRLNQNTPPQPAVHFGLIASGDTVLNSGQERDIIARQDCQKIALVGLVGVGKTQVALQFAYTAKSSHPDFSILWVSSLSHASFEKTYLEVGKKLSIPMKANEDPMASIRDFFNKRTFEKKDDKRITSEYTLASAYLNSRRIEDMIRILEMVVAVQRLTLDEPDQARLESEHELGSAYLDSRRIKDAIVILEHVVEVGERTLNEEDFDRIASEHVLTTAYLRDGRIKEAIKMLEHVVEVCGKTLKEEDHSRLTSEHVLAKSYLDDGRPKDAIRILRHVVEMQARILEEQDYLRLRSECVLGEALLEDGQVGEALAILENVVVIQQGAFKEDDYLRLLSEYALGKPYRKDGRVKDSIQLLEFVIEVQAEALKPGDNGRLATESELAAAYLDDGRFGDAVEWLEHVVQMQEGTTHEENDKHQNLLRDAREKLEAESEKK